MPARFVWLSENGKLYPAVWHDLVGTPLHPKTQAPIRTPVAEHALSDDELRIPLDQLAAKYPAPAVAQGDKIKVGAAS